MKKIVMLLFLALNLFLLTNCNREGKEENSKIGTKLEVQDEKEQKVVKINETFTENEKKLIQLFNQQSLENFLENTKKITEKLKNSTKKEANKIYKECQENINSLIENLNAEHTSVLEKIYPYVGDIPEGYFSEENIKNVNKFLANYDLRITYIGEGEYAIDIVPSFYYDIFKDYVTDDYKEYLKFIAKEKEELYASDGGILISFKDLGERIIGWENFLEKYPNSDFAFIVSEKCISYRKDYILGMMNTPTLDGGYNGKPYTINEENLVEFNRFIKAYPDSPTTELVKYFLENYQNKNIDEEISKMAEETAREILDKYAY